MADRKDQPVLGSGSFELLRPRDKANMTKITLLPIDAALGRQLRLGKAAFEARFAVRAGDAWPMVCDVVGQILERLASTVTSRPWCGYLVVDATQRVVVGTCAFKSPPSHRGEVEIAYFTFPPYEGRGYGTAMARELIALGGAATEVRCILAHTLPQRNASTRILERLGLTRVGTVEDPDDGPVWRWQLTTSQPVPHATPKRES
jgi:RimJ/RimL family protein N-acetyltransferase